MTTTATNSLVGTVILVAAVRPAGAEDAAAVRALVERHCVACHNASRSEGSLRLDRFDETAWGDFDLLDAVATRVADGDMPPEDAETPLSGADRKAFLAQLGTRVESLASARLAGAYKRLTADEYAHTLEDVFGVPLDDLRSLPYDSPHDVRKLGEHQVVTAFAVRKYYEAAHEYLDANLLVERPVARTITYTPDNGKDFVGRGYTSREGAYAGGGNAPNFLVRNPVTGYADEGDYELEFEWHCFLVPPGKSNGSSAGPPANWREFEKVEPFQPPTVKLFRHAAVTLLDPDETSKDGRQFQVRIDEPIRMRLGRDAKFITIRGPEKGFRTGPPDPRAVKIEESDLPEAEKKKARQQLKSRLKKEAATKPSMRLLVTKATFRGPLDKPEPPAHAFVFGDVKRTDDLPACEAVVRRMARRLFRRPVPEEVVRPYLELARDEYARTNNVYAGVRVALNTMLCSPHFVFKFEGRERELDDHIIASRLSYLLWDSAPDEKLLALAEQGRLRDPAVRREQALRLLADRDRSQRFANGFTRQWLGLEKFGEYSPNVAYLATERFAAIKPHMAAEPRAFFEELLHENLSARNLIDSDFVVWNAELRGHYGKDVKVDPRAFDDDRGFRRLSLTQNTGRRRGGLPTMAAIASLTTDGENTQPILRGVWVARHLLGLEIEAPVSVPAIEINLENVSKPREVLELHKTDKSCYACHVKFDYLGLAMEHYDVLGQWRDKYVHPSVDEKGRPKLATRDPIDALSANPVDETPIPGMQGLKQHLQAREPQVMRHLVETLFGYAVGREPRYGDRDRITALVESSAARDFALRDMVLDLVASPSFVER